MNAHAVTKMATADARELQPTAQAATPSYLLQLAVQQGADLDKLEKLMALQERWEANESRKAFMVAMNGFKSEPIEIRKSKHVEFTTRSGDVTAYDHAELSDITEAIGPKLAKYDLSYRWNVQQKEGAIAIECILTHASGHSERVLMHAPPDSSGGKNTIQQIASTTTYLQRYTLLAITGMSTKGNDDDGRGAADANDTDQAADWYAAIEAAQTPDDLKRVADEVKDAGLPARALRNVRAMWTKRNKELSA